jgi:hypothetical protein
MLLYYVGNIKGELKTLPRGIKMLAGDPANSLETTWLQAKKKAVFYCGNALDGVVSSASIPVCESGDDLRFKIFFPECWNGVDLDSPDHKSHLAYAYTGDYNKFPATNCPSTHPVRIPQIGYLIVYPSASYITTASLRLSSDSYDAAFPGGLSAHADYMEAWMTPFFDMIMNNCLLPHKDCGVGNLGNGLKMQ